MHFFLGVLRAKDREGNLFQGPNNMLLLGVAEPGWQRLLQRSNNTLAGGGREREGHNLISGPRIKWWGILFQGPNNML